MNKQENHIEKIQRLKRIITQSPDPLVTTKIHYNLIQNLSKGSSSRIAVPVHSSIQLIAERSDKTVEAVVLESVDYIADTLPTKKLPSGSSLIEEPFNPDLFETSMNSLIKRIEEGKSKDPIKELKHLLRVAIAKCSGLYPRSQSHALWTISFPKRNLTFQRKSHHFIARLCYLYGFKNYSVFLSFATYEYLQHIKSS